MRQAFSPSHVFNQMEIKAKLLHSTVVTYLRINIGNGDLSDIINCIIRCHVGTAPRIW